MTRRLKRALLGGRSLIATSYHVGDERWLTVLDPFAGRLRCWGVPCLLSWAETGAWEASMPRRDHGTWRMYH